ncbi:MAG: hypothetical protein JKY37_05260 [Nannocystaceae bacterium]|nr:hypothetical protein [Nannocystaceae bacterium]
MAACLGWIFAVSVSAAPMPWSKQGLLSSFLGLCLGVFVAGPGGCSKPLPASERPHGGATGSGGATAPGSLEIRYSDLPVVLRQDARVDFTTTGGGAYAQATFEAQLEVSLRGGGKGSAKDSAKDPDSVEVRWQVLGLDAVKLDGSLAAKGEDVATYVQAHGRGVWVIARSGVLDHRAGAAHPGNAKRLAALQLADAALADRRAAGQQDAVPAPGATLLKLLPELISLPRLPAGPIAIGATIETTEAHDTVLTGTELVIPTETTVRYTLVSVQSGAGIRLAELVFTSEDWGEPSLEDGEVELRNTTEGTMLFDVDRGTPVTVSFTREESLVAGEVSYDTTKIVSASYERS